MTMRSCDRVGLGEVLTSSASTKAELAFLCSNLAPICGFVHICVCVCCVQKEQRHCHHISGNYVPHFLVWQLSVLKRLAISKGDFFRDDEPKNDDDLKNEDNLKNKDNIKHKDNLKNTNNLKKDDPKNEDDGDVPKNERVLPPW